MFNLFLQTQGSQIWFFVIVGGFFIVMMLLTIIPQRKRQKQMKEMMSSLQIGNKVKTIGGFVGKIVAMNEADDTLTLNIGTEKEPVNVNIARLGVYMNMDAPQNTTTKTGGSGEEKQSI